MTNFTWLDGISDDVISVCNGLVTNLEETIELDGTIPFLKKPNMNKLDQTSYLIISNTLHEFIPAY
jgi:hypothetical protein